MINKQIGKYIIVNLDFTYFKRLYRQYLEDLKLYNETVQGGIMIKEYDTKYIKLKKSGMNVIEYDIGDFRKEQKYNELLSITKKIKNTVKKKWVSSYSIIVLLSGTSMIIFGIYFLSKYK